MSEQPAPNPVRLYSSGQIAGATFLGGVFGGTWLFATNFYRLGQIKQARLTLLLGGLATLLLGAIAIATARSQSETTAMGAFAFVPIFVMRQLAQSLQGRAYERNLASGGRRASTWLTIGLGLSALVITLAVFAGGFLAFEAFERPPHVDIAGSDVFYNDGGTEAEARAVGEMLLKHRFFTERSPATVVVKNLEGRHVVKLVVKPRVFLEKGTQIAIHELAEPIAASAFRGEPTDLWLADDQMARKLSLVWESRPRPIDLGHEHLVVYFDSAVEAKAKALAKTLQSLQYFQDSNPARVSVRTGVANKFLVEFIVTRWDEHTRDGFYLIEDRLSQDAFDGRPVDIELVDGTLGSRANLAWETRPQPLEVEDGHVIQCFDGVSDEEARKLATLLTKYRYFVPGTRAQASAKRAGTRRIVGLTVNPDPRNTPSVLHELAVELSTTVFDGLPVDVRLQNPQREPLTEVASDKPI
jgi:hypothetical protein